MAGVTAIRPPGVGFFFQRMFHRCERHVLNNCGQGGLDSMQIQIQNPCAACVGSPLFLCM